jgi:two-component system, LuxR family, sensor kinase FixL
MKPYAQMSPDTESPQKLQALLDAAADETTRRRQSEEAALRMQERLTQVSRIATFGAIASGIAHEINQPLAAIATYAHACDRLLGMPEPQNEEVQYALRQIADQAVRAGDIIQRLRSLPRDDDTQRRPADINAVIAELTDLIRSDAKAHAVAYRTDFAADLPKLTVDRAQIQQVVLTLVCNALEALALGPATAREIVIRTRLTRERDVQISVCDTGPGVESGIADRMFDPFCSTKPGGTGLGLAISRTIIHSHRGTLDYQPNVPRGACFAIRLPTMQGHEP